MTSEFRTGSEQPLRTAKIALCLVLWSGVMAGAVAVTLAMGWLALFLYGGAMVIVCLTAERETDAVGVSQNAGELTAIQARAAQSRTKAEREAAHHEAGDLRRLMRLPKLVGLMFAAVGPGLFLFGENLLTGIGS